MKSKKFCKNKKVNKVSPQSTEAKHIFKESNPSYCSPKPVERVAPASNVGRSPLDTLETTSENSLAFDKSRKNDKERLKRRGQKKYFMQYLSVSMAELRTPLEEQYRDTFYCSSIITVIGQEAKSTFCKRRWCIICNNIRTAQLITRYLPTIESWDNKHFLTLTVKNPPASELGTTMNQMHQYFSEIKDSERKAERKLVGIRKLETTFNPEDNTFHPHFHFILKDGESCEQIIRKWLYKFNSHIDKKDIDRIREEIQNRIKKGKCAKQYIKLNNEDEAIRKQMLADPQFQDFKPADNKSAKYLFKYFVKLAPHKKKDRSIYVNALV